MSLILPGDMAAQIVKKSHEVIGEKYGDSMVESRIGDVFDVISGSELSHGLYHRETQEIHDGVPLERRPGEAIDSGALREEQYALGLRRFFARSYQIPREMLEYARMGGANALGSIEAWAAAKSREFAEKRFEAEQQHAAKIFNKGGLTAGHPVFDNSYPGLEADSGGDLCYDSKPLFNLTGNARTAVNASTYYNGVALSLSATNLATLENLVADTNGYTETGDRLNTVPNVLVVPQALRQTAEQIVNARALAGTANNDANPYASYQVIVWPYLDDSDAWFVGKAKHGLRWIQDDQPPTVEFKYDAQRRTDCLFIQSCFGAYVRPSGWRFWGGSNFATS